MWSTAWDSFYHLLPYCSPVRGGRIRNLWLFHIPPRKFACQQLYRWQIWYFHLIATIGSTKKRNATPLYPIWLYSEEKLGAGLFSNFKVPTLYPLRVSSNSPVETPLHSTYTLSGPWERMFTNSGYSKGAIYSNKKVLRFGLVKIGITPFKKSMDQYLGIFTRQGKVISYLYTIDCVEVRFHNTLTCEDSIWDNFQFKLLQMQQKFYIN